MSEDNKLAEQALQRITNMQDMVYVIANAVYVLVFVIVLAATYVIAKDIEHG